jgi:nucleotide-binding universal stress UspA family protein
MHFFHKEVVPVSGLRDSEQPVALFADDGEPAADVAWAWIVSHSWAGWELQAVTVRQELFPGGPEIKPSRYVRRSPPAEAGFASCSHIQVTGDPRVVLLGRSDTSLMVVGSHQRGHIVGLWAGSATESLLVNPRAPMLIARHGYPTRSVALCVDGSPHSQRAIQAFWSLPWSGTVEVNLVSVDDGRTDVEQSLQQVQATLPPGICPARVERLSGSPKQVLATFVRDNQIDLVVMGTRGLTGLARMRVGSTVSALLKDGSTNLLIAHVPESGAVEPR